ncbi:MAG: IS630 family transposase [Candidatus Aquirickettsiella gammari]|uniref:IS630 family transposase n=1 Tax=Candidatus Aquirickettsiella gammari TaxID=2016198 RepID=A0A370CJC3_9COXI|nr:MAG: IS630 family transposase [Candidatus Aquirickettsiella gammari]
MEKLSELERKKLIEQHRKERDKRLCDRIKAVLAYDDGYSYSEIARLLLLDDESIRRHIKDYWSDKKLSPENGGSECRLTSHESLELIDHLCQKTYLYVKDICLYVKTKYQKYYSVSGLRKWLHAHRFRYKKPHAVPTKIDSAAQQAFIEFYNKLKRQAGATEPIYFSDSTHPAHQTQLHYGWILRGQRKAIATTSKQLRVNLIGGICLKSRRVIYQQADRVNADSIAAFLVALRRRHPEKCKIHVIWDNAGYHHDKRIKAFAKGLAIELHYLPPYSSNLNPIERLWKLIRECVMYNKYYETFSAFTDAIRHFLNNIGRKKRILRSRITDNFHLLHPHNFAS